MADVAGPGNASFQEKESLWPALFAIIESMKVARPFVYFVMKNLQQHVKKTLENEAQDCNCFGCELFDAGPMCFNVVSLDAKTGIFKASEGHCF